MSPHREAHLKREAKPAEALDAPSLQVLFTDGIEPKLAVLETQRVSAVWQCGLWMVLGVPASILIGALIAALDAYWGIAIGIVCLIVAYAAGWGRLYYLGEDARRLMLQALADALALRYWEHGFQRYGDGAPPGLLRCAEVGLLPTAVSASGSDIFEGRRNGSAFTIYNAALSSRKGAVYRGLAVWIDYPQPYQGVTLLTRDAGLLNGLHGRADGLQVIRFGPRQFEQAFEVFGTDQIEARTLLHPALLETLLEIEQRFQGQQLRAAFVDGDLLICVQGHQRFKLGSLFSPFTRYQRVERIAGDLVAVMRLVDTVLAGPPRAYETERKLPGGKRRAEASDPAGGPGGPP